MHKISPLDSQNFLFPAIDVFGTGAKTKNRGDSMAVGPASFELSRFSPRCSVYSCRRRETFPSEV